MASLKKVETKHISKIFIENMFVFQNTKLKKPCSKPKFLAENITKKIRSFPSTEPQTTTVVSDH